MDDEENNNILFQDVVVYLSPSLQPETADALNEILRRGGAKSIDRTIAHTATHIISESHSLERLDLPSPPTADQNIVTPHWAWAAAYLGRLPEPRYYSTDPRKIFSGVVGCSSDIPPHDRETIAAGIMSLGGQWRYSLTKDVTHLFALEPTGEKYESALHYHQLIGQPRIVAPHWFDDSFKCQSLQPVQQYLFPDPPIFNGALSISNLAKEDPPVLEYDEDIAKKLQRIAFEPGSNDKKAKDRKDIEDRVKLQAVWKSVSQVEKMPPEGVFPTVPDISFWDGRRILLSASLAMDAKRLDSIASSVTNSGGEIVSPPQMDPDNYDILITGFAEGEEYDMAKAANKIIGTVSWLFHVLATQRITAPEDHLLHVPPRADHVGKFLGLSVTISNYTGEARDYLKALLLRLGAEVTPELKRNVTKMCISSKVDGKKTERCYQWGLPVVNHLWVEACYTQWDYVEPSAYGGIYTSYPPGVDYSNVLGQRRASDDTDKRASNLRESNNRGNRPVRGAPAPRVSEGTPNDVLTTVHVGTDGLEEQVGSHSIKTTPRETSIAPAPASIVVDLRSDPPDAEDGIEIDTNSPVPGGDFELPLSEPPAPQRSESLSANDDMEVENAVFNEGLSGTPISVTSVLRGMEPKPTSQQADDARSSPPPQPKRPFTSTPKVTNTRPKANGSHTAVVSFSHSENSDLEVLDTQNSSKRTPKANKPKPKIRAKPKPPAKNQTRSTKVAVDLERIEIADTDSDDDIASPEEVLRSTQHPRIPPPSPSSSPPSPAPTTEGTTASSSTSIRKSKGRKSAISNGLSKLHDRRDQASDHSDTESEPASAKGKSKKPVAHSSGAAKAKASGRNHSTSQETIELDTVVSTSKAAYEHAESEMDWEMTAGPSNAGPSQSEDDPLDGIASALATRGSQSSSKKKIAQTSPSSLGGKKEQGAVSRNGKQTVPGPLSLSEGGPSAKPADSGRSKRAAAVKATAGLAADMKDANDHFASLRASHGDVRKLSLGKRNRGNAGEAEDNTEDTTPRVARKPRISATQKETSKDGDIPETEDEAAHESRSTVKRSKNLSITSVRPPPSKTDSQGKGQGVRKIKVLLSKAGIKDDHDAFKKLKKLGVTVTSNASECTHLISTGISRTEKFVRAMNVARYALDPAWVTDSAKEGRLLPESDYAIQDPKNEEKYCFVLSELLSRPKDTRGKVLHGMTFYITNSVSPSYEILKNVVQSAGGKLINAPKPTLRQLHGQGKFLVSCPVDADVWKTIAHEGKPVYDVALILNSVLRQEMDWEGAVEPVRLDTD